ncbi:adhesin [Aerococcus urinaeequi]|uniref:adhesin n=1 Tax=Aerococcus urinaeequi TaxID=51665 RepID=UPI00288E7AF8|nr:adhesin [Aerococcus urinaeequi]MDT2762634.1 adhesin [Aerococcus urinaeequi]
MNRKSNRNQMVLTAVFIVISLVLVGGSYFVYRSRQQNMLADQASTFSSMSVDMNQTAPSTPEEYNAEDMVQAFTDNRGETTALHYLYYLQSVEQVPTISIARTQADQEAWTTTISDRLNEIGFDDTSVNSVDLTEITSADAVEQYSSNLTEANPQLLIIPTFVEEDYEAEISEEDHLANIEELFNTIRMDLPSALIVFAQYPASSQEMSEDEDYITYNDNTLSTMQEAGYNVYDVNTAYSEARDNSESLNLEKSFTDEGFSEEASQLMANTLMAQIEDTQINATDGYDGANEDVAEMQAELDAQAESESIAAEEQASLDAEAESIAAEEQASIDAENASIAESESIAAEESAAAEAAYISESIAAEEAAAEEDYYYSEPEPDYGWSESSESSSESSSEAADTSQESVIEEESTSDETSVSE